MATGAFKAILLKEFRQEFRMRSALGGILLYGVGSIYISYLSFKQVIDPITWNALFWVILLFAAVNALAKSFIQEPRGRQFYYYFLVPPRALIMAKIAYNSVFMTGISLFCYLFYAFFIKSLVQDHLVFLLTLILGSLSFASVLTLVSALVSRTQGNFSLMAVLSFPLLMPLLITLVKLSKLAVDGLDQSLSIPYFVVLGAINVIVLVLSYILFPYLWRD